MDHHEDIRTLDDVRDGCLKGLFATATVCGFVKVGDDDRPSLTSTGKAMALVLGGMLVEAEAEAA